VFSCFSKEPPISPFKNSHLQLIAAQSQFAGLCEDHPDMHAFVHCRTIFVGDFNASGLNARVHHIRVILHNTSVDVRMIRYKMHCCMELQWNTMVSWSQQVCKPGLGVL
jgi:hypothetical protein